jgi:DNA-damage-inducible protein D
VGYERLREIADPALALERTRENWRKLGRSEKWITQRMTGQETRNKLTDYWASHEVKQGQEFAILTNIIHEEWSGVSVKEHKGPERAGKPESSRSHERGRTHLHGPGRAFHASDRGD